MPREPANPVWRGARMDECPSCARAVCPIEFGFSNVHGHDRRPCTSSVGERDRCKARAVEVHSPFHTQRSVPRRLN